MLLLACSLILFMVIGVPIGFSMGASSLLYFLVYQPALISVLPARVFAGMDSALMLALPLFIIMGHLINHGGLTSRLIDFCMLFVGRLRGGLGMVSVMSSMIFGRISGSSVSDAASIAQATIPAIQKKGYPLRTAAGLSPRFVDSDDRSAQHSYGDLCLFRLRSIGKLFLGSLIAQV